MTSKILLVNFSQSEADKLKGLPLTFERGYFSDLLEIPKQAAILRSYQNDYDDEGKPKRAVGDIDFYFPHPVYEYKAVFINLNQNEAVKQEFTSKVKKFSEEDRKDFLKYWLMRGSPIVVFLGDYRFKDLFDLGLPGFSLTKVVNQDVAVNVADPERGGDVAKLFSSLKSEVIMPTHNYIGLEDKTALFGENSEYKVQYLYWNNNKEDLGIFVEYDKGYSPTDRPRVLLLPQFKNNPVVVEKILLLIAKLYPKYLPAMSQLDWLESDEYYPKEVKQCNSQISLVVEDAKTKIKELEAEQDNARKKYAHIKGLLHKSGDDLEADVIKVLTEVFKLEVIDADEEKTGLLAEDIIIKLPAKKILAEVKGVKSENPSPTFIAQVWKHLHQNKDKDIQKGALILNYDLEKNPNERHLAYTGEQEKSLEDIIFVDTRVMFELALAVIDHGMPPEDAVAVLLQDGRVEFSLDDYLNPKNTSVQQ